MLADSGAGVLISEPHLAERLPAFAGPIVLAGSGPWHADVSPRAETSAEDIAYVIYTSGSTGVPKGSAMGHGVLANLIEWQCEVSTPRREPRTVHFAPLSFDVSFQEIFSTWAAGGTLVLIPDSLRRDSQAFISFLAEFRIDRLFLPFVALQQLAEIGAEPASPIPPLKEVVTAGEQLQVSTAVIQFFQRLTNCTLHNQYGPTETHVVTAFELTANPEEWPGLPPIGRPIWNARIYLLDERLEPVPTGLPGQIYIAGGVLALGYLNREDLTSERFLPDPYVSGGRMYATGDLARYLPSGDIEFLGRVDSQVKIRGFRIELGEIEVTIARHPGVAQSAVAAGDDESGREVPCGIHRARGPASPNLCRTP